MTFDNLHLTSGPQKTESPTKTIGRSRYPIAVFGFLLTGLVLVGGGFPPSPVTSWSLAQTLDPSLCPTSLEAIWAILAWAPQRAVSSLGLPLPVVTSLIPAVVVSFYFASFFPRWNWVGGFLVSSTLLAAVSGGLLQITGADALAVVLFGAAFAQQHRIGRGRRGFLAGFLGGNGWVLAIPVVFLLGTHRVRRGRIAWIPIVAGVLTNTAVFSLFQWRYPNPSSLSADPATVDWVQSWLGLDSSIPWGELGWWGSLAHFPGSVGILCGFLGVIVGVGLERIWTHSAGRTVPFQLALFSIPPIVLGIAIWIGLPGSDPENAILPPHQVERNLRTLFRKADRPTQFYLPVSQLGIAHRLSQREWFPQPRTQEPIGVGAFETEAPPLQQPHLQNDQWVQVEFNGENFVRVHNEPLAFRPHYLLDAATEVWAATPQFFIANDPGSRTDRPTLFLENEPLAQGGLTSALFKDWNWDGGHFFVYKSRSDGEWEFPLGEWRVDYSGYLMQSDFDNFGDRTVVKDPPPLTDFY